MTIYPDVSSGVPPRRARYSYYVKPDGTICDGPKLPGGEEDPFPEVTIPCPKLPSDWNEAEGPTFHLPNEKRCHPDRNKLCRCYFVKPDGTLSESPEPHAKKKKWRQRWKQAARLLVTGLVCNYWLCPNPLADGNIPAASQEPHEHWNRIQGDLLFATTMTRALFPGKNPNPIKRYHLEQGEEPEFIVLPEGDNFGGGPDGHVKEWIDWFGKASFQLQGPRGSTTRTAITAYFCGADVAKNQPMGWTGLFHHEGKPSYSGVDSFSEFIQCRHHEGTRNGSHRRAVYRLGIANRHPLAGFNHAVSVIAQPDGTFFCLQSFSGHYTLAEWMGMTNLDGASPRAHLTLDQLQAKLKRLTRLMNITTAWTKQANKDYLDLFGVDKKAVAKKWRPYHRLDLFAWDEACEYPAPTTGDSDDGATALPVDDAYFGSANDSCFIDNLMTQLGSAPGMEDLLLRVNLDNGEPDLFPTEDLLRDII